VLADQMEYLVAHFPALEPAARSHPALAQLKRPRASGRSMRA